MIVILQGCQYKCNPVKFEKLKMSKRVYTDLEDTDYLDYLIAVTKYAILLLKADENKSYDQVEQELIDNGVDAIAASTVIQSLRGKNFKDRLKEKSTQRYTRN